MRIFSLQSCSTVLQHCGCRTHCDGFGQAMAPPRSQARTDCTFRLLCAVICASALAQALLFFAPSSRPGRASPSGFSLASALDPHQAAEAARQEHAALLSEAARTSYRRERGGWEPRRG
jgi:hypothetical protein